jgi:hypothetical protein
MNIFGRERLSIIYYFVENSIPVCCKEKHSVAMLNMIRRRKASSLVCHHVSLCNVYLCSHFDLSRAFIPLIHADTSRLRDSVCATPIRPQSGMEFVDTLNTVLASFITRHLTVIVSVFLSLVVACILCRLPVTHTLDTLCIANNLGIKALPL